MMLTEKKAILYSYANKSLHLHLSLRLQFLDQSLQLTTASQNLFSEKCSTNNRPYTVINTDIT